MEKISKTNSKIDSVIKFIALIAIFSGAYGVSFQKGMITAMNLGNLSGNYDLREIFNSAVLGILWVITNLLEIDTLAFVYKLAIPSLVMFIAVALIISYIYKNPTAIQSKVNKLVLVTKSLPQKTLGSYFYSLIAGIVACASYILVGILALYSSIMVISIFVFPSLLGYMNGISYVEDLIESPPCVAVTEEVLNRPLLVQCTQVAINGNRIMGEVILENKDAYFIQQNTTFLYVRKDGSNCIFSVHVSPDSVTKPEDFSFDEKHLSELCFST